MADMQGTKTFGPELPAGLEGIADPAAAWPILRLAFDTGWQSCIDHMECGLSADDLRRQMEIACDDLPVILKNTMAALREEQT